MFIDPGTESACPPSGGPCSGRHCGFQSRHGPPDGGRPLFRIASINMALLPEGEELLADADPQVQATLSA
jgi:hypothetical protein